MYIYHGHKNDTDIDGSGGWDYSYVQEFIQNNWDK